MLGGATAVALSEFNKKPKYKKGGLMDRDISAGGHKYLVFFKLNGKTMSAQVIGNTKSVAERWVKYQYPSAQIINSRMLY